ncbi:MAG: hypothetical protein V6Z82_03910 [Flavobacteriales bacterium]
MKSIDKIKRKPLGLWMGYALLLTACQRDEQQLSAALRFSIHVQEIPRAQEVGIANQTHADKGAQITGQAEQRVAKTASPTAREETETTTTDDPTVVKIQISISDGSAATIDTTLTYDETRNISGPLYLAPGTYFITNFLAKNSSNTTIYTAPEKGSSMSQFVSQPLPLAFTIAAKSMRRARVDVIPANGRGSREFGHTDFSVHIVPISHFHLAVLDGETQALIDFYLTLSASTARDPRDGSTKQTAKRVFIDNRHYKAGIWRILIPETYGDFYIRISASGHQTMVQTKTLKELKARVYPNVWNVYLKQTREKPHRNNLQGTQLNAAS